MGTRRRLVRRSGGCWRWARWDGGTDRGQAVDGPPGVTGPALPAGPQGPTGAAGAAGAPGLPGLVYRGNYSSVTNYALGDVVLWQGASYASLLDGNHGNTPSGSLAEWGVLTAQGPVGATGAQGSQGVAGPQGPAGVGGASGGAGPARFAGTFWAGRGARVDWPCWYSGSVGPMGPQGPALWG